MFGADGVVGVREPAARIGVYDGWKASDDMMPEVVNMLRWQ
jgi:hypothetical protein